MLDDYIAIATIAVALIVIVYIVSRKFPVVAAIKTEQLIRHRQERLKKGLMENRLKRKLRLHKLPTVFRGSEGNPSVFQRLHQTLRDIEQRYRLKIHEIEPTDDADSERKVSTLITEALAKEEAGEYKEAEARYIQAISIDAKSEEAYEGLGTLYMVMKDYEHAVEIYQYLLKLHEAGDAAVAASTDAQSGSTAVSLNATVAAYHVELGEVYQAMQKPAEAHLQFIEAIKLEPNSPRILDLVIESALSLKHKETAETYIKKLKEVNPDNEKVKEFQKAVKELS
ncbi:MAG: hypothetical protein HZC01_04450 [Candidatus Kerfeldbacteria bacterium]|nr:hypothetical protein [Candidatus Kerfeldbacteria bacterium]